MYRKRPGLDLCYSKGPKPVKGSKGQRKCNSLSKYCFCWQCVCFYALLPSKNRPISWPIALSHLSDASWQCQRERGNQSSQGWCLHKLSGYMGFTDTYAEEGKLFSMPTTSSHQSQHLNRLTNIMLSLNFASPLYRS